MLGMSATDQPIDWDVIYELRTDHDRLNAMIALSQDKRSPDMGLAPTPYLVGSREFWKAIAAGDLETTVWEGSISETYWAGMGDMPRFKILSDSDEVSDWIQWGDPHRFVAGLRAKVLTVQMPWKKPNDMLGRESRLVLSVSLERSELRTRGCGPGPMHHLVPDGLDVVVVVSQFGCHPVWQEKLFGNIDPSELPIDASLIGDLNAWAQRCDNVLGKEGPLPESLEIESDLLFDEGEALASRLSDQLGDSCSVEYWGHRERLRPPKGWLERR